MEEPGVTIYSRDGIGIEALVKYNWSRSNSTIQFDNLASETTTFTNQLDFSIGFQIYFDRLRPANPDERGGAPERSDEFY